MKKRILWMLCLLTTTAASVSAESLSFTSRLNSSEDVFTTTFTLATADAVTLPAGHSWTVNSSPAMHPSAVLAGAK